MDKLKKEIICEYLMMFGCIIIIGLYIGGLIGMADFYVSNFLDSTIIMILTIMIFMLVFERHSHSLKLLIEKENKEI